jgi:dienelactone hydrolase
MRFSVAGSLGSLGAFVFALSLVPSPAFAAAPSLSVEPATALLDQTVHVTAKGLAPAARVDIVAETQDAKGLVWRSSARCSADAKGNVDLATCDSQGETYRGIDAMGLFWSMQPPAGAQVSAFSNDAESLTYAFSLRLDGATVASASLQRISRGPGVQLVALPHPLVGAAYAPATSGKHAAVLLVGGSEGGHSFDRYASVLASHGYVTVSLAYFGEASLPAELMNVPLEPVAAALDWLAHRPDVDPSRIGMLGMSKGGELTLLAASMFPQIHAAIAIVPSSVVWNGISHTNFTPTSSWTYGGQSIPFVPYDAQAGMALGMQFAAQKPVALEPLYTASLGNAQAVQVAAIAVEKIKGPVLLISGEADRMWPSTPMSSAVMARLQQAHHPYKDAHLHFAGAGHTLLSLYAPTYGYDTLRFPGGGFEFGGTPEGDAKAAEAAVPAISAFLESALR